MKSKEQTNTLHQPESVIDNIMTRCLEGDELMKDIDAISARIAQVASDGFGPGKTMSPERIKGRLIKEPYVILAENKGKLLGFQFQSIHTTQEQRYLYYSRVIREDQQGKGIAQLLLNEAIDLYGPSVVGARSQNPAEILSFIKLMEKKGIESIYPFNMNNEEVQVILTEFLKEIGFLGKVEIRTGLGKNSYEEGRLGDYGIEFENLKIKQIEEYLQTIGLSRDSGDTVFYFARLLNKYKK